MKRLSTALDRRNVEREDEQQIDNGRCAVSGCPLMGSLSHETHGHNKFFCYIHFNHIDATGIVTTNIVERKTMIKMARRGLNMNAYDWDLSREKLKPYLMHHNRQDLLPGEDENVYLWAERVLRKLKDECLKGMREPIDHWQD